MIFDAHTHLSGVQSVCNNQHIVSENLSDWDSLLALSREGMYCSIGIHPWFAQKGIDCFEKLKTKLVDNPQVNIGEIGLDYSQPDVNRVVQIDLFRRQLQLAIELNRVVTIHSVHAWGDMLAVIRDLGLPVKGAIFHGFRGSVEIVKELIKQNCYFSLGQKEIINCGKKQHKVIISVPIECLLVESDGVGDITAVLSDLSKLRSEEIDALCQSLNNNFECLFDEK